MMLLHPCTWKWAVSAQLKLSLSSSRACRRQPLSVLANVYLHVSLYLFLFFQVLNFLDSALLTPDQTFQNSQTRTLRYKRPTKPHSDLPNRGLAHSRLDISNRWSHLSAGNTTPSLTFARAHGASTTNKLSFSYIPS
jgi:hypothetical protein